MIFRKSIFLFIFFSLFFMNGHVLFAQNDMMMVDGQMYVKKVPKVKIDKKKFNELFTQANLMMMESFNDTALRTFLILHDMVPNNANINFKIGQL